MKSGSLNRRFREIVAAMGAIGPSLLLNSCLVDVSQFDDPMCGEAAQSLAAVHLAPDVDGMALVQGVPNMPTAVVGTICGGAMNMAACLQQVAVSTPPRILRGGCTGHCSPGPGVIVTRGDVVSSLTSAAELVAALGPIDSAQEAVLVAIANGYSVGCSMRAYGAVRAVAGGWEVVGTRGNGCDATLYQIVVFVDPAGAVRERNSAVLRWASPGCVSGRRPRGLRDRAQSQRTRRPLASHLARMARLEAASVCAFQRLARELKLHQAPIALCRAALRSARDEARHAKVIGRLARAHGGRVRPVGKTEHSTRSVVDIALENAVEGCVFETWGALLAHYQAKHATDSNIADAMQTIAREESMHAELSLKVDEWIGTLLSETQRERIQRARSLAVERLRTSLEGSIADELRGPLGLPDGLTARLLFAAVQPLLEVGWS